MSSSDSKYEPTPEQRRQAVASILATGLIRVFQREWQARQKEFQSLPKSGKSVAYPLEDS